MAVKTEAGPVQVVIEPSKGRAQALAQEVQNLPVSPTGPSTCLSAASSTSAELGSPAAGVVTSPHPLRRPRPRRLEYSRTESPVCPWWRCLVAGMERGMCVPLSDGNVDGPRVCQEGPRRGIVAAIGAQLKAGLERVSRELSQRSSTRVVPYIEAWWPRAKNPLAQEARASHFPGPRSRGHCQQGSSMGRVKGR